MSELTKQVLAEVIDRASMLLSQEENYVKEYEAKLRHHRAARDAQLATMKELRAILDKSP